MLLCQLGRARIWIKEQLIRWEVRVNMQLVQMTLKFLLKRHTHPQLHPVVSFYFIFIVFRQKKLRENLPDWHIFFLLYWIQMQHLNASSVSRRTPVHV